MLVTLVVASSRFSDEDDDEGPEPDDSRRVRGDNA
jgi:hypothetical protein